MAAVKLKLVPNPIFYAKVEIPVAGDEPAEMEVTMTFKHRTREQLDEWMKTDTPLIDAVLEMAQAWDLEEPFDRANLVVMDQNYQAAMPAILQKYLDELRLGKVKN